MSGRQEMYSQFDILIIEDSISGQRGGNYNFDFGYTLYGSVLRFEVVQVIEQFTIDSDVLTINEIVHTDGEINPQ
jgi:hypothetical protein